MILCTSERASDGYKIQYGSRQFSVYSRSVCAQIFSTNRQYMLKRQNRWSPTNGCSICLRVYVIQCACGLNTLQLLVLLLFLLAFSRICRPRHVCFHCFNRQPYVRRIVSRLKCMLFTSRISGYSRIILQLHCNFTFSIICHTTIYMFYSKTNIFYFKPYKDILNIYCVQKVDLIVLLYLILTKQKR